MRARKSVDADLVLVRRLQADFDGVERVADRDEAHTAKAAGEKVLSGITSDFSAESTVRFTGKARIQPRGRQSARPHLELARLGRGLRRSRLVRHPRLRHVKK